MEFRLINKPKVDFSDGTVKYFVIPDYNQYTANEVVSQTALGRHFDEAVRLVYKTEKLDLGFNKKVVKPFVQSHLGEDKRC